MPFTGEITTDHHLRLPFLDEALAGVLAAVEARMSAALIVPAGTGKTALFRRLRDALSVDIFDAIHLDRGQFNGIVYFIAKAHGDASFVE